MEICKKLKSKSERQANEMGLLMPTPPNVLKMSSTKHTHTHTHTVALNGGFSRAHSHGSPREAWSNLKRSRPWHQRDLMAGLSHLCWAGGWPGAQCTQHKLWSFTKHQRSTAKHLHTHTQRTQHTRTHACAHASTH